MNKKLKIVFLSKNDWTKDGINHQKTNAGYINVSSPELTALDFFAYSHKFGINRIVTVLQELAERMKMTKLAIIAKQYSNTVAIQRLGYILETELLQRKLADSLWKILN